MKQTNTKIESSLKEAFQNATPDLMDSILADCENEKGRILTMTEEKRFFKQKKSYITIAACFMLVFAAFAGYFALNNQNISHNTTTPNIAATVTLDVNPSIEIQVDENEKTIAVLPLNEDAKTAIGEMDFTGSNIDVTIHALIGSMVTKGYITDFKNCVLLSVESANHATELREKLTAEISALIGENTFGGSVITQTVNNTNEELKELAQAYNISVGKAQLVNTVLSVKNDKTFAELATASVTELYLALAEENFTENNHSIELEAEGAIINNEYCGVDHAVKEALDHYGYHENEITELKTNLEVIDGLICYTVSFRIETDTYFKNYKVIINAVTGNYHTGGYSGGAYNHNKIPSENVPEGHLSISEATELACSKAGVDKESAKITIHLGHIDSEYVWGIDIETESAVYSMDIYTKTSEIVNYTRTEK